MNRLFAKGLVGFVICLGIMLPVSISYTQPVLAEGTAGKGAIDTIAVRLGQPLSSKIGLDPCFDSSGQHYFVLSERFPDNLPARFGDGDTTAFDIKKYDLHGRLMDSVDVSSAVNQTAEQMRFMHKRCTNCFEFALQGYGDGLVLIATPWASRVLGTDMSQLKKTEFTEDSLVHLLFFDQHMKVYKQLKIGQNVFWRIRSIYKQGEDIYACGDDRLVNLSRCRYEGRLPEAYPISFIHLGNDSVYIGMGNGDTLNLYYRQGFNLRSNGVGWLTDSKPFVSIGLGPKAEWRNTTLFGNLLIIPNYGSACLVAYNMANHQQHIIRLSSDNSSADELYHRCFPFGYGPQLFVSVGFPNIKMYDLKAVLKDSLQ